MHSLQKVLPRHRALPGKVLRLPSRRRPVVYRMFVHVLDM